MTITTDASKNIKDYELCLMGQPILDAERTGNRLYVVVEGEVAILLGDKLVKTIRSGGFVDELLLQETECFGLTAIAQTNCQLIAIDETMCAALERHPPDFIVQIMQVMVERLTRQVKPPIQPLLPSRPAQKIVRAREQVITFKIFKNNYVLQEA